MGHTKALNYNIFILFLLTPLLVTFENLYSLPYCFKIESLTGCITHSTLNDPILSKEV